MMQDGQDGDKLWSTGDIKAMEHAKQVKRDIVYY
jgi:hypothetical protein